MTLPRLVSVRASSLAIHFLKKTFIGTYLLQTPFSRLYSISECRIRETPDEDTGDMGPFYGHEEFEAHLIELNLIVNCREICRVLILILFYSLYSTDCILSISDNNIFFTWHCSWYGDVIDTKVATIVYRSTASVRRYPHQFLELGLSHSMLLYRTCKKIILTFINVVKSSDGSTQFSSSR